MAKYLGTDTEMVRHEDDGPASLLCRVASPGCDVGMAASVSIT